MLGFGVGFLVCVGLGGRCGRNKGSISVCVIVIAISSVGASSRARRRFVTAARKSQQAATRERSATAFLSLSLSIYVFVSVLMIICFRATGHLACATTSRLLFLWCVVWNCTRSLHSASLFPFAFAMAFISFSRTESTLGDFSVIHFGVS